MWTLLPAGHADDVLRNVCLRLRREVGGIHDPPNTPIGRDELALKRHRFFSDLLSAAQAAAEHRVRFNPLGPDISIAEDNSGNLERRKICFPSYLE